jgi:hypothetical protein
MNRRRKRRLPFAAYAALAFNAAICLTPFVAARAMSTAYGDKKPAFEATPEAITATIQAMDARFTKLSLEGDGAPREVWSGMVREELEANNMTSVRGLLLSAPAMLDGADGAALKARVAVADQSGEAGVLAAAVAYLPEELQDEYERRSASPLAMFSNSASSPAPSAAAQEPPAPDDEDAPARFQILGDLRDLALQAASWARQDRIDEFAFTLAGVGLILADPEAREGASIALSARRSQTLDPEFQAYLERKLFDAVPPAELKKVLEAEFQSDYGYGTTGPAVVESVFKSSVDRVALESALADYRILREIANNTSAQAAVAIISKVKDGSDLSRAQLVATAGGDRAVALARYDGDHLLDTARTTITWTNALRLQVAGVLTCLVLLGFLALSVFVKSFTRSRPKKFSAVYLGEEPAR